MKDAYVQAIHECIAAGMEPAALLARVRSVMEARGHERLLAAVLRTVLRELAASRTTRTVVRVSDESAYESHKAAIEAALKDLNNQETPTVVTDRSLIGGYQVEANYQRVEASYKQHLTSLYRNITTHNN